MLFDEIWFAQAKIVSLCVQDGGSGYLFDQPPEVSLRLPRTDPDWFVTPTIRGEDFDDDENQSIAARVSLMRSGSTNITVDIGAVRRGIAEATLGDNTLQKIKNDPIGLLPSNVRPQFSKFLTSESTDVIENGYFSIPSLPPSPFVAPLPSSNYRSIDPLFGGIGKAPVTKSALSLSAGQYSRLALSGAICTVIVRTALNPLELVKTKVQLGNDEEIIQYAMKKATEKLDKNPEKDDTVLESKSKLKSKKNNNLSASTSQQTKSSSPTEPPAKSKPAIGTVDVINSLIEVRGPLSLFQSADITFLTSIVFGIFGFGATELFRRSFSTVFFDEASAGSPNEFVFLAAAAFATLLTCAAGAVSC